MAKKNISLIEKKNTAAIIEALAKSKNIQGVIDSLNDKSINSVCECLYNIIYKDLNLPPKKLNALRRHIKKKCQAKRLKLICCKKHPVSKRRELLKQEGSGLPLLLLTAVPFIIDMITRLTSK